MLDMMKNYNWNRAVVLSSNFLLWQDAGKAVRKVFDENNVTMAYSSEYERYPPDAYVRRVLKKAKEEARSK